MREIPGALILERDLKNRSAMLPSQLLDDAAPVSGRNDRARLKHCATHMKKWHRNPGNGFANTVPTRGFRVI
jgi:hypothetical protein